MLLRWEFIVTPVADHGLFHLCSPPRLKGEKDRTDDYITGATSHHRVLESLAKRILVLFELLHLFLQIITAPLDARERPLDGSPKGRTCSGFAMNAPQARRSLPALTNITAKRGWLIR